MNDLAFLVHLFGDHRVKALHHNAVSQRKTLNTLVNIVAIERAFEPGRMRNGVGVF